ncbi:hypothetical protein ACTUSZ_02365 [Pantoea eucalypti]|uniref:hypothetical protein n=1 Tax=Pantoea eucalypti TaxID=470933 RepID=UPI003FA43D1C
MTAQNKTKYLIAIFIAIALAGVSLSLKLQDFADDLVFSHALDNTSLYDFMAGSYASWSGRFTLNALMVGTINYHAVWKIGIPLSIAILCTSVSRIITGRFDFKVTALSLFAYLLLPKEILANGSWWVTGFYNYLLPAAAMAYSLSVFMKRGSVGLVEGALSLLCLSISCFSEQTSLVTIVSALLLVIFCREFRRAFSYAYILLTAVLSWVMFSSPGNFHRLQEETWRWMPGYESESLINKLIYGYDRIHQAMVMSDSVAFCILCVLCIILIIKDEARTKIGSFFSLTLMIHVSLILLIKLGLLHPGESFYNPEYLNPQRWISISRYASYFFTGLVILGVCYASASAALKDKDFIKPLVMILLGFATVLMVGFSPTVYASGMRVLYLWAVMIMCAACFIFHKLYGHNEKTMVNVIFCAIAAYIISI